MNTLIKVIVALVISIFFTSCNFNFQNGVTGNGNVISQDREVNQTFETIKATEGIDVFVAQGAKTSIKVEADENVIDLIETKVNNGKLLIECREQIGRVSAKKVYVTLPNISNLETTSGANLNSMGTLNANNITLEASSGSDLIVELQADEVTTNASSGADIELYGVTNILIARASSGSDIKAERLKAHTVEAHASSGADIDVNASEEIAIHKSSGGDVGYKGNPKRVEKVKID
ncbi:head GIN domain-containing protein [Galbibacter orientalis]|uniref:Putative auto-transporter adhesin head GIN domain-containing protein n=1 Tax=Galbibacter orientalis DSM 19592 TaxID=926559 RepID=I3C961_9FLAO|nr:head GIN domain-containing protein [Galbibacter orientalis]EIJ40154.1 Protein of unknown function (DUF2807) [Galbibacter orientalis DSM 19592]